MNDDRRLVKDVLIVIACLWLSVATIFRLPVAAVLGTRVVAPTECAPGVYYIADGTRCPFNRVAR